jgi:hypothetical protein
MKDIGTRADRRAGGFWLRLQAVGVERTVLRLLSRSMTM